MAQSGIINGTYCGPGCKVATVYIWIADSIVRISKVHYGSDVDIKVVGYAGAQRYFAIDPIDKRCGVVEGLGDEGE